MGRRNVFKYRCLDCKAEEMIWRGSMVRVTREKCSSCGSLYLEPVTKEAKDRTGLGQNAKIDFDEKRDA